MLSVYFGNVVRKKQERCPRLARIISLVSQIEIYDQVWSIRDGNAGEGRHSKKAIELVKRFVDKLEEIPDGGTELFLFELIRDLKD